MTGNTLPREPEDIKNLVLSLLRLKELDRTQGVRSRPYVHRVAGQ